MLYKLGLGLIVAAVVVVAIGLGVDQSMRWSTREQVYTDVNQVPARPTALLLGTSKYVGKRLNQFYMTRVEQAASLYRQGKVKRFIVSGYRASRYYNEPRTMLRDLVKRGVPEEIIEVDNEGFRTIDSLLHAKNRFGEDRLIIVSQRFHLTRALFIARHLDMDCVGFIADDAPFSYYWRTRLREVAARILAVWEVYIGYPLQHLLQP